MKRNWPTMISFWIRFYTLMGLGAAILLYSPLGLAESDVNPETSQEGADIPSEFATIQRLLDDVSLDCRRSELSLDECQKVFQQKISSNNQVKAQFVGYREWLYTMIDQPVAQALGSQRFPENIAYSKVEDQLNLRLASTASVGYVAPLIIRSVQMALIGYSIGSMKSVGKKYIEMAGRDWTKQRQDCMQRQNMDFFALDGIDPSGYDRQYLDSIRKFNERYKLEHAKPCL